MPNAPKAQLVLNKSFEDPPPEPPPLDDEVAAVLAALQPKPNTRTINNKRLINVFVFS
jgi:hypothetical protein